MAGLIDNDMGNCSNDRNFSICGINFILNNDSFWEYNMYGNGYDWQTVVCAFLEKYKAQLKGKLTFGCEANTFSMQSKTKNVESFWYYIFTIIENINLKQDRQKKEIVL